MRNLSVLKALVAQMEKRAPVVPQHYQEKLQRRLREWCVEVTEPQRIAQEIAIMADKCAIEEELSRLCSHMEQFAQGVQTTGEIGRKLDFLLQEMNREVNTIGAKGSDVEIAQCVVDAKCAIEKMREQVQNAE